MCHDLDSKADFLTCYRARSAFWGWDAKPTATTSFRNLGRRQKPFTGRLGCLQNAVDSVARHASNSRATSLRGPGGILMPASPGGKNKTMERDGVRKLSVFRIGVLSGMALLWVIVAVLQYKWATQLSAATEVRIGSNLQSLMTRWQRDLYDELSAVCVALQVGPDSGAHDAWNDYLQRYAEWNGNEKNSDVAEGAYANPDLVRERFTIGKPACRESWNFCGSIQTQRPGTV